MAEQIRRLTAEPDVVEELRRRSRSSTIGMRDRERAAIILLRLQGLGVDAVAARLHTTAKRVSSWSRRFATAGLAGLNDCPGRGRNRGVAANRPSRRRRWRGWSPR
jgi:transposase